MKHESPGDEPTFGYLSAVESPDHGYFGGYLIVSAHGRPLEFHCTAPVKPSRAQQILFGPTLYAHLVGEQIAGTLLGAAKLTPRLILTDCRETVAPRGTQSSPLVFVPTDQPIEPAAATAHDSPRTQPGASGQPAHSTEMKHPSWGDPMTVGGCQLQLSIGNRASVGEIVAWLELLAERVEIREPFDRIHEAICEAQRIGTRGPEAYGHAA